MRRVLLAIVGVLAACAPPTPKAPRVTTAAGRECVSTCKSIYNVCVGELRVGGNYWSVNQPNSFGEVKNCDDSLASCYTTCASS
jgi:hypothetical protein